MLDAIRRYFRDHMDPREPLDEDPQHRLQLATAALLIEVSRTDNRMDDVERTAILEGIRRKFDLDDRETDELLELARREAEESVSYFEFTSLINQHFSREQKQRVIELMWRVAVADGSIDKHQEALIRKIADLLYVPHRDFISAKLRVLDEQARDA